MIRTTLATGIPMHAPRRPPVIAVTCGRRAVGPAGLATQRVRPARPEIFLARAYLDALARHGAVPVLLPPVSSEIPSLVAWALRSVDGLVISGGAFDIHPSLDWLNPPSFQLLDEEVQEFILSMQVSDPLNLVLAAHRNCYLHSP